MHPWSMPKETLLGQLPNLTEGLVAKRAEV
jgi:hypothetical protein